MAGTSAEYGVEATSPSLVGPVQELQYAVELCPPRRASVRFQPQWLADQRKRRFIPARTPGFARIALAMAAQLGFDADSSPPPN